MKTKEELLKDREKLFKQQKSINSNLRKNYDLLKIVIEEENQKKIDNWNDDWEWLLYFDEKEIESKVKYDFLCQKIQELGLFSSGYNRKANQRVLQISSYTKNNYEALTKLLPYINSYFNEDLKCDCKFIDILDKDCSYYGSYDLFISKDSFIIGRYEYRKFSIIKKFSSLKESLNWIEDNLFDKE